MSGAGAGAGLGIADVAARSGVSASALRYYETRGLITAPPRISGRRRYDPSVLDRLAVISAARRAGFTLAEVGELLDGMTNGGSVNQSWRVMAARKLTEVERLIAQFEAVRELLRAVEECRCDDIAQCAALLRGGEGRTRRGELCSRPTPDS